MMKKLFSAAMFLLAFTAAILSFGCERADAPDDGIAAVVTEELMRETVPVLDMEPEKHKPEDYSISLSQALEDEAIENDETICVGQICFYSSDGETPETSIMRFDDFQPVTNTKLARTRYYEELLPDDVHFVFDLVDYAISNGYTRIAFSKEDFTYAELFDTEDYLELTYVINAGYVGENGIKILLTEQIYDEGEKYYFSLIKLTGFENFDMDKFFEGIDEGIRIVDQMPEEYDELEKVTYMYSYLTKTVEYEMGDYYGLESGEEDWNLVYDTLITHKTVCAGYAEALYYMCNYAGIDCIIVDGWINDYYTGGHAWNAIKIDGKYYYFDSTWDAEYPMEYYSYFGVSRKNLNNDIYHHFNVEWKNGVPECNENISPAYWAAYYG